MTKEMQDQPASQEVIKEKLTRLRAVLSREGDVNSSEIFDEFVHEHEWGLALHVVCDYLLKPTTQAAAAIVIQQIQTLHEAMRIQDACVADLRGKAGQHLSD